MEIPNFTPQCKTHQCSLCQDDTEFTCETCRLNLCFHCKERHVADLSTKYHRVIIYRERFRIIQKQGKCTKHPGMVYRRYCDQCELPLCTKCTEHRKHKIQNIVTTYKTKRKHHEKFIDRIETDILYTRRVFLEENKADFENFRKDMDGCHLHILRKARRLNSCIDYAVDYLSKKHKCKLIQKLRNKQMAMKKHIAYLQDYEYMYEQSATSPVQCLRLMKKEHHPEINDSPTLSRHSQFSVTGSFNQGHMIKLLCDIQISERGKRYLENKHQFKPLSIPEKIKVFSVKDVEKMSHISCVTADRVWVSDPDILLLTDTSGNYLHELADITSQLLSGIFSVNSDNELIYIDTYLNINKLSDDMQKCTTFIARTDTTMDPVSLYCSRSSGDIFVGMWIFEIMKRKFQSKILRYNHKGQLSQTILHTTDQGILKRPGFMTENNNGDIIMTNSLPPDSVVAIGRKGNHRFTYTGHSNYPKNIFYPYGICTDTLSNILVSDVNTGSIHMLDENGHFLSYLLKNSQESFGPYTLSYDVNTHLLWVGTCNNNIIYAFRYLDREDVITAAKKKAIASDGSPQIGTIQI